jgi:AraC-like DNA-binding protein
MKVVLLIGAFQAFFFALLVQQKKQKANHDFILAAWLCYLGLFIGSYAFYTKELFDSKPQLISSYMSLFLLHGPFLYYYTRSLISKPKRLFDYQTLLHLSPFILFNIYLLVAFHIRQGENLPWLYLAFILTTVFSGPFYMFWVIRMIHNHRKTLEDSFSYREKIDLIWLRNLSIVFGVVWIALISVAVVHHVMFLFTDDFCTNGLFLSLALFVIISGYFGLKQAVITGFNEPETTVTQRYSGTNLDDGQVSEYLKRLEICMSIEKPYRDPLLTLGQLANKTGITLHYLSRIINEQKNQNFFDYINSYRIEEVKEKINNPAYSYLSLLGIAFDSGFNSKSAFNRFFKKITGVTPSMYKSKNKT